MSDKNSSITRVAPLAEAIIKDHSLVDKLLSLLPRVPNILFGEFTDESVFFMLPPQKDEKSLPPTKEHLLGIIEKIENDENFRNSIGNKAINNSTSKNKDKRKLLFDLDKLTLKEAKDLVSNIRTRSWHVFEGTSKPDLFIENKHFILLIEGKRTEPSTTDSVTYLPKRSQIIRHIENALDYCNRQKKVIAFYIIEDKCGYKEKCSLNYLPLELENETIKKTQVTKNEIIESFYGFTTWQKLEENLGIIFPDTV